MRAVLTQLRIKDRMIDNLIDENFKLHKEKKLCFWWAVWVSIILCINLAVALIFGGGFK